MILTAITTAALLGAQSAQSGEPREHRTFRFTYEAGVPDVPADAQLVRLWIPVPLDTPDQEIRDMELRVKAGKGEMLSYWATPENAKGMDQGPARLIVADVEGGFGRSLCVETKGEPISVSLAFDVKRYETRGGGKATKEELEELTQADMMIPLDGKVAAMSASMKVPADRLEAARVLYDHTLERMNYDKPQPNNGWGRGDAEWACDARYGNCTDFHSYFMGLCRARGIPARFEMGFPIPDGAGEKTVGGYHCWAFFWKDGHGWVPVDISEADKHPEKTDYFFGTLDAGRVTMTGGRDLTLTPEPAAGALNFFVYPYAEADGVAVDVTKGFKSVEK